MKNTHMVSAFLFVLASQLIPLEAFAEKFVGPFLELELPPGFGCNQEHAEWVCKNVKDPKKKDFGIVFAAKAIGPKDVFEQKEMVRFRKPESYKNSKGIAVKGQHKFSKIINVSGQTWVDALVDEPALPGFRTRYLETVKDDIGILVSFSVKYDKYQYYLNDINNTIKSLKAFRKPIQVYAESTPSPLATAVQIPVSEKTESVFGGIRIQGEKDPTPASTQKPLPLGIILAVLVGGLGFFFWKIRKR